MPLWIFLPVQIYGSLKHGRRPRPTPPPPLLLCMSLRYSSIIATQKVEGWKECILNLDNCAAAFIYGAEQKHYSPIAADG